MTSPLHSMAMVAAAQLDNRNREREQQQRQHEAPQSEMMMTEAEDREAPSNCSMAIVSSDESSVAFPPYEAASRSDSSFSTSSLDSTASATAVEDFPFTSPSKDAVVTQVNDNDVLCGRGGETNHHTGNVRYRQLVKSFQKEYLVARRRDKPQIAKRIVGIVYARGGRFLKKVSVSQWKDVGLTKAREKTSQALREGAPEIRNDVTSTPEDGAVVVTSPSTEEPTPTNNTSNKRSSKKKRKRQQQEQEEQHQRGATTESEASTEPPTHITGFPPEVTSAAVVQDEPKTVDPISMDASSFTSQTVYDQQPPWEYLESPTATTADVMIRGPRLLILKKRMKYADVTASATTTLST